jgi:hypothetical protein
MEMRGVLNAKPPLYQAGRVFQRCVGLAVLTNAKPARAGETGNTASGFGRKVGYFLSFFFAA